MPRPQELQLEEPVISAEAIQLGDSMMMPVNIAAVTPRSQQLQIWEPSIDPVFGKEALECAICMDAMQKCVQLVCGHSFHAACVNRWLYGDGHGRCPMCRQRALPMQANPPVRVGARWQQRRATESEERLVLAADHGRRQMTGRRRGCRDSRPVSVRAYIRTVRYCVARA